MKKMIFSLMLVILAAQSAFAQSFYLKAGLGYAFPMPGQKFDQDGNFLNGKVLYGSNTEHYNLKTASFSAGAQGALGGGIMISKNIGVELDANFNLGPVTYIERHPPTGKIDYYYTAERTANNFVTLMPSLLLQTANDKFNVYMRMGLALPLNAKINLMESYQFTNGTLGEIDWKVTNYFSLGFTGATGVSMAIGQGFSVWAEAGMMSLSLARKEKDMIAMRTNGADIPLSSVKGITQFHYNKDGYNDPYGNQSSFGQPFSNLSATAGIKYQLMKAPTKKVKH